MRDSSRFFVDTVIEDDAPVGEPLDTASAELELDDPDAWVRGWHDSSYALRRGLMVIELDLDPGLTHGALPAPRR